MKTKRRNQVRKGSHGGMQLVLTEDVAASTTSLVVTIIGPDRPGGRGCDLRGAGIGRSPQRQSVATRFPAVETPAVVGSMSGRQPKASAAVCCPGEIMKIPLSPLEFARHAG